MVGCSPWFIPVGSLSKGIRHGTITYFFIRTSQPARALHIPQANSALDSGVGGTNETVTRKHALV